MLVFILFKWDYNNGGNSEKKEESIMKKNLIVYLTRDLDHDIDYKALADEVGFAVVAIDQKSKESNEAAKQMIAALKENGIAYGVVTTLTATNLDDVHDEAYLYFDRALSAGADKDTWFFINVEEPKISGMRIADMRSAVAQFHKALSEAGARHIGIQLKEHEAKRAEIKLNKFEVVCAVDHNENDGKHHPFDKKMFGYPEIHQYTAAGKLKAIPHHDVTLAHCEDNFSIEQLVAAEPVHGKYMTTRPYQIKLKENVNFYSDKELQHEEGRYSIGEELVIKDLYFDPTLRTSSLKTEHDTWITGARQMVETTYFECPSHIDQELTLKVPTGVYSSTEFDNQTFMEDEHAGTHFKVVGIARAESGKPRLAINREKDGHPLYITARKDVIKFEK